MSSLAGQKDLPIPKDVKYGDTNDGMGRNIDMFDLYV